MLEFMALGENLGHKKIFLVVHVLTVVQLRLTNSLKGNIMLKNVIAWVEAHSDRRMDSHAFMACIFDLGVSSADETMFRACWNLATMPGQAGTATVAVIEAAKKEEVAIVAWYDRSSHVIEYHRFIGMQSRASGAVRHDIGRSFSRRFF